MDNSVEYANKLIIIPTKNTNYSYNTKEVEDFIANINWYKGDIKGKCLFLSSKTISQNKLREAGFTLCRDKDKADLIVVSNIMKLKYAYYSTETTMRMDPGVDSIFAEFAAEEPKQYSYVLDTDVYKYLYKYEGNLELYTQISELFKSKDYSNTQMAMEFMSNANWEGNDIYLQDLFNRYYNHFIRGHQYKSSISFQGFLNSLTFRYKSVNFYEADHYRDLCITDEHHDFVKNMFKDDFEKDLEELFKKHKFVIDKLEYSIDKSKPLIIEENE